MKKRKPRPRPRQTNRSIPEEIGASPTTVGKARVQVSTDGHLEDRVGRDGKSYPSTQPAKSAPARTRKLTRPERYVLHNRLSHARSTPSAAKREAHLRALMGLPSRAFSDGTGIRDEP
jgi:hypothetical protein